MGGTPTGATGVALLASVVRREEKQILAALDRRRVDYVHLDSRRLHVALDGPVPPGRVLLNREIAHTRAFYAALAWEARGLRTLNTASAIETCGDKWRTATALRAAGVPTPRTLLALTPEAALSAAEELGYPAVLKPLVSSWGRRVVLVRDPDAASAVLEYCAALPSPQARVLCVQEPVGKGGRDIRVIVVGGRCLGAAHRVSGEWRANVALGARTEPAVLTEELADVSLCAARATGTEVAGVDVVEDDDGRPYVLEVNAGPEFQGFAGATGIDVAGALADHLTTVAVP